MAMAACLVLLPARTGVLLVILVVSGLLSAYQPRGGR
jgi:BioD-like phosphotransacetylase family protein